MPEMKTYIIPAVLVVAGAIAAAVFLAYRKLLSQLPAFVEKIRPLEIKLLTANVGNAYLLRFLSGFKMKDSEAEVIRRNIGRISPDIVFLQELGSSRQVDILFGSGDYLAQYSHGNCIAVRKSVFSRLINIETNLEAEGFIHCRAYAPGPGIELSLFNVHALSPMRDPSYEKRRGQIKNMFDKIRKARDSGMKIIVAGDFNFDPYRFERFLAKMDDAGKESELKLLLEGWNNEFKDSRPGGLCVASTEKPTWFFNKYRFSIDHVITNLAVHDCRVLDTEENRIDIDHGYEMESIDERFMDHRACVANIALDFDPGRLEGIKEKLLYRLSGRHTERIRYRDS